MFSYVAAIKLDLLVPGSNSCQKSRSYTCVDQMTPVLCSVYQALRYFSEGVSAVYVSPSSRNRTQVVGQKRSDPSRGFY